MVGERAPSRKAVRSAGSALDTGVSGVGMEFSWSYYFVGYG